MKQFYLPTKVITGLGCFSQIPEIIHASGQEALLVCGRNALRRSGILERALSGLQQVGVHTVLYDAVTSEPTLDMVQSALNLARQEQVEVVIGIGGGSAMDVGKAAAALYTQDGTVQDSVGVNDAWSDLHSVEVLLRGREETHGEDLDRELVTRFFPRNVLSR